MLPLHVASREEKNRARIEGKSMIKDMQTIKQLTIEVLQTTKKTFELTKDLDVAINIKKLNKILDIIDKDRSDKQYEKRNNKGIKRIDN